MCLADAATSGSRNFEAPRLGRCARGRNFDEACTNGLTLKRRYVHLRIVHAKRLHYALQKLSDAILEVESELASMKAEPDPLASHIFVSRRQYRNVHDTKGGKRREVAARLTYNQACELGFRGSFGEWERLMGAVASR